MLKEVDASNRFLVGMQGEEIVIFAVGRRLSHDDALNLAAWIVTLADPLGEEFAEVLKAVRRW